MFSRISRCVSVVYVKEEGKEGRREGGRGRGVEGRSKEGRGRDEKEGKK